MCLNIILRPLFERHHNFCAATELSERICVMGISMNLVTYLVAILHIPSAKSATIVTNFMGTLNLLGLLGGFLADAKLGRYLAVATFGAITALVSSKLQYDPTSLKSIYNITADALYLAPGGDLVNIGYNHS